MRFNFLYAAVLLLTTGPGLPGTAWAQAGAPPTFYARYRYTAYTVFDATEDGPPTQVRGVGGTLQLWPDGRYEKRLSIVGNGGPMYFNQTGRFTLAGDSIRFAFSDLKGADVQRGTFRYAPATRRFTLTILGYPSGNKGVYELEAEAEKPAPKRIGRRPALRPRVRK